VVHARDDPIAPFAHGRYAAETIPGARLIILERGGHFGLLSNREAFGEALAFLHAHP
jgi:pimeloyl-ACP methyl ester carboxylesterase